VQTAPTRAEGSNGYIGDDKNSFFPTNYPVLHATVYSNESHTNSHCLSLLRFAPSADSIILVAVFGAEFSSFSTRTC
jgi:hypothetical protein